jgi:hypothetical protein
MVTLTAAASVNMMAVDRRSGMKGRIAALISITFVVGCLAGVPGER